MYVKCSLSGKKFPSLNYTKLVLALVSTVFFVNLLLSGSPNVTSLEYDQSRTLTCASTGGPATTVTWRRDGAAITLNATHQQTKTITDNSTSTYQTVLTISQSVDQSDIPGLYSCTVENARGSSSRAVVIPGNGKFMINKYAQCGA